MRTFGECNVLAVGFDARLPQMENEGTCALITWRQEIFALGGVRKLSLWICSGNERVIPFSMELVAHDVQVRHFGVGDLHAGWIFRLIEHATDSQAL